MNFSLKLNFSDELLIEFKNYRIKSFNFKFIKLNFSLNCKNFYAYRLFNFNKNSYIIIKDFKLQTFSY